MDHSGDIAIGYSASGPNYFPSLHYAGRLVTDPLNELTQGEGVMFQGLGIQGFPLDRWGDYSDLTVDPTDDCTFWYTNEYNDANTTTDLLPVKWRTRIGSFRFPQCSNVIVDHLPVVSRMTHGSAGDFDVSLPYPPASRGVECRSNGGNYKLIFTFPNSLASVGSATVSTGTGTVSSSMIGPNPNQYTVNLTGVANAQYIAVTLSSVVDSAGNTGNIVSPQMGVLIGDVNASGRVDAADVSSVRQQTLQTVTSSNFREDVNASGRIDAADVSVARQQTLTSLPSSP
jgi:hypothetical protein